MRLALYGKTALSILMTLTSLPRDHAVGQDTLRHCGPTDQAVRYALERWPRLGLPLHLLTDRWEVGCRLGRTMRIRSTRFTASQQALFNLDWSLQTLFPSEGRKSRETAHHSKDVRTSALP